MTLKLKFNLVMIVAFTAGLGLAGVFVNSFSRATARNTVLSEAAIMMANVNAVMHYTDAEVSPLLARSAKVQFLPQAIPFFAAQRSFDLLGKERHDYTLRQPADNPTNPSDRPSEWEKGTIQTFQTHPELTTLTTERTTEAGEVLSFSQPVRVTGESCLACHSTPQAAPPSLIDVYGSANGFGWKLGSTVGAQIVSVPEQVALDRAHKTFLTIMAGLAGVFIAMLAVLNLLLHWLIIGPVRQISRTANEVSLGNMELPEFDAGSNDEIGSLAMSFNRMRRSLVAAFHLLGG